MKNLKKAVALTLVAGGLVAAGAGAASATGHGGAEANGKAVHSPGVASGNLVQAPVHIPVNAVGNTVSVIGALNPAFGNHGLNH
ncbi:chaplin [Streptomyces sp. NPDC058657]|uniref:chaplin n=1 Tax=unclassified Streptomyces TaxID=2593676 RepID=UPI00365BEDAD